jgi:hypothetical protein
MNKLTKAFLLSLVFATPVVISAPIVQAKTTTSVNTSNLVANRTVEAAPKAGKTKTRRRRRRRRPVKTSNMMNSSQPGIKTLGKK